ncbi:MAG TPA: SOS response-associated peptidase [Acidimicrobiales bacterium]|nr:SOS response-associated peptidase [Acidimicrobiales bacterium]
MCGRVDIHTPPSELARLLEVALAAGVDPDGRPSWNVPPTRGVPVVIEEKEDQENGAKRADGAVARKVPPSPEDLHRRLEVYRWGLLPHWAKDPRISYKMINARAENLTKSSAYRTPFRKNRCLIVVDGFYEWQVPDSTKPKSKVPFYFRRADGSPITFAGLYEIWWDKSRSKDPDPETLLRTCAIITTEAGPDMVEVHNRMPVIIERSRFDLWLDPDQHDPEFLLEMLRPAPAGTLVKHPIDKAVNSPRNDGPQIIEPIQVVPQP